MNRFLLSFVLFALVGCGGNPAPKSALKAVPKGMFSKHVSNNLQELIERCEKKHNPDYILIEIHRDGCTGVQPKHYLGSESDPEEDEAPLKKTKSKKGPQ